MARTCAMPMETRGLPSVTARTAMTMTPTRTRGRKTRHGGIDSVAQTTATTTPTRTDSTVRPTGAMTAMTPGTMCTGGSDEPGDGSSRTATAVTSSMSMVMDVDEAEGGEDCDDANSDINPDADETWYVGSTRTVMGTATTRTRTVPRSQTTAMTPTRN